ncbi:hypothetical protein D3C87_1760440 [compost metagenome]
MLYKCSSEAKLLSVSGPNGPDFQRVLVCLGLFLAVHLPVSASCGLDFQRGKLLRVNSKKLVAP